MAPPSRRKLHPGTPERARRSPALLATSVAAAVLAAGSLARAASGSSPPGLPPAPPGATCLTIQRGLAGNVFDTDVSPGFGSWAAGNYPGLWTGLSSSNHWTLVRFDLSPIPAGAQIVLSTFSINVGWTDKPSTVRAHRITADWSEQTTSWANFGGAASWDPAVIGSFDPTGYGYKSIDVTALTQGWQSGAVAAHGLLLEEDPVVSHFYFSSESSAQGIRPRLDVCYVIGGPCAGKGEGAGCDDGNQCTTGETCQAGQCGGGQAVTCAAQDGCHEAGLCDPATGQCTSPPKPDGAACDDANACTAVDYCLSGACAGGGPVTCDDGDACTGDVCDPAVGCTAMASVSCADSLACTTDLCAAGSCEHVIGCPPGQPCSPDFCDTPAGQSPQLAWLCQ